MKVAFFLLLSLVLFSCSDEPEAAPSKNTIDKSYVYDLGGDEIATCMIPLGDNNLLFVQSSSVSYYLLLVDEWGEEISRKEFPLSTSQFVAESMLDLGDGKFLLAGALDGKPAFCQGDSSATSPLTFYSQSEQMGRWYDATVHNGSVYLCGQLQVNGEWQVLMGKLNQSGDLGDSLTFGTPDSDGGIDLMSNNGKLYLLAFSYGLGKGDRDFWVMNIDQDLQPANQQAFGGAGYDQPEQLMAAKGSVYVCGHTTSYGDPMHDAYFICLKEDLSLRWEKNVALESHEGADDMCLLEDGNIGWCSYGALPIDRGYFGVMTPEGQVLHQRKFSEYGRMFRMRSYKDHVLFLAGTSIVTTDIGLRSLSYDW